MKPAKPDRIDPHEPERRPSPRSRPRAAPPKAEDVEPTVFIQLPRGPVSDYAAPTRIQPGISDLARAIDQRPSSPRPPPPSEPRPSRPSAPSHRPAPEPPSELQRVSPFGDEWAAAGLVDPDPSDPLPVPATPAPRSRKPARSRWLPLITGITGVAVGLPLGLLLGPPTSRSSADDASSAAQSERRAPLTTATIVSPAKVSPPAPTTPAGSPPASISAPTPPAPSSVSEPTPPAPSSVPEPTRPAPPRPPAWTRVARELNPWIDVAGATEDVTLGLPASMPRRSGREVRTGFSPALGVHAPRYDYRIQTHEVTWQELGLYIATRESDVPSPPAWALREPSGIERLPATGVSWRFARQYCMAMGGDLPSEPEWAWAARGPELRTQPWGDALPDARLVRFRRGDPVPLAAVGTQTQDATPGPKAIRGLLGNASEWTRDPWIPSEPGGEQPGKDDADVWMAVRGWPLGAAGSPLPAEGLTYRRPVCAEGPCLERGSDALELVGFRCVERM